MIDINFLQQDIKTLKPFTMVSIDPGTANMGVAIWNVSEHLTRLTDFKTLYAVKSDVVKGRAYYRAVDAMIAFKNYVKNLEPSVFAIESYHIRGRRSQQDGMLLLIGMILEYLIAHKKLIFLVEPKEWMTFNKKNEFVKEILTGGQRSSEHARDAVMIGAYVLAKHGMLRIS